MAATSATTFSIGSTASAGCKVDHLKQSKAFRIKFNSKNYLRTFNGLKSANSVNCESVSSFLGSESQTALKRSYKGKPQKQNQRSYSYVQPQASYKVAVLGAAGGIGQPLALLVKMSPLVSALNLYDIANVKELRLISVTATHPLSNPVNSTVPIAAEVLKQKGVYDPKKLFGVTTLDVVRANTFVAQKKNLRLIDVDVPVIGGHAGITILPLLSKTKPSVTFTDDEVEELTVRIQNAGTEVVEAKAGAGSATLSMAYAAARFVESSLRALDGDSDVYECAYIQSDLTELPFFASRIKLGRNGVEAVIGSELQGLTEYEQKALEALKPELKSSIEKGVAFVQKQPVTA
ncbi:hypothetical protein DH2020_043227 [Rehmannia glutinosa]|uniref:Malate dehydrogenase n=1 Tax=Rehmannia glutinosa TaxID=99300 RepID=A0ABR0UL72_REHGL